MILGGQLVFAKTHGSTEGYKSLVEANWGVAKTTRMFLRQDHRGHEFLCIAFDVGILSILNVSNPAEPRKVDDLRLTGAEDNFMVGGLAIRLRLQHELHIGRRVDCGRFKKWPMSQSYPSV
jgi:hypothetical protein